jgi:CRISPR-associated endonuclease Csy4
MIKKTTTQPKNNPMKFYLEITILPNQEIDKNFILSRLFAQIHLGLVEVARVSNNRDRSAIAVAFPEYKFNKKDKFDTAGSKIRLFAKNKQDLEAFPLKKLENLQDYISLSRIEEVPSNIETYSIYQRYQPKTSYDRLAKRYLKREQELLEIIKNSHNQTEINNAKQDLQKRQEQRNGESLDKYLDGYKDIALKKNNLPYINIKSESTANSNIDIKNHYKLWIKETKVSSSKGGDFNTYGLSTFFNNEPKNLSTEEKVKLLPNVPDFKS